MRRLEIAFGLLVACSTAPRPAPLPDVPPPAAPAIPWFDRVDLVTLNDGEVTGYSTAGKTLDRLGSLTVAEAKDVMFFDGRWADRDNLFVESGGEAITHLTAAHVDRIEVPDASTLVATKPTSTDGMELVAGIGGGAVVAPSELWWSHCAWGFPADGFQCERYVHTQLWPTAKTVVSRDLITPADEGDWGKDVAPAGFKLAKIDRGVRCDPPSGTPLTVAGDPDQNEEIFATHWISTAPPRLLVVFGSPGYADLLPTRWSLYAGCAGDPIERGETVAPGWHGLWRATVKAGDNVTITIRRGAEVLGELKGAVAFRPR